MSVLMVSAAAGNTRSRIKFEKVLKFLAKNFAVSKIGCIFATFFGDAESTDQTEYIERFAIVTK